MILLVILLTMIGAVGSYYFKVATMKTSSIREIIRQKEFYIGGILYMVSVLLYIFILKKMSLSTLIPLTSLTYVWSMGISFILLKEKFSKKKFIGAISLVMGFITISISR